MQFSNPIWLWSLSGLLVPIGIHILSRKEGRVILMGSLRYLRELPTPQFRHLKLNEIPLLLLRSFLVILLVMLLAGAWANWFQGHDQKWVVLEQGIEKSERVRPIIKSLENKGFEIRLMAKGFPLLSDGTHQTLIDNYWTVVRDLTSKSLDSIIVFSFNYQRKFKGERIPIPSNMKWLTHDVEEKEFIAQKIPMNNDSVWVRKGYTSSLITSFETQKAPSFLPGDSLPLTEPTALDISIFTGEGFAYDEKIVVASLKAIQSITPQEIKIITKKINEWKNSTRGLIFWLANETPPITQGGITIVYRNCESENLPLLTSSNEATHYCDDLQNETWVITQRLNEEIALKENLALQLARLILPPLKNDQYDHRVFPETMLGSYNNKNDTESFNKERRGNIDSYIIILVLLTLVTERWLAYKRNQ